MNPRLQSGLYVITDCETLSGQVLLERTTRILRAGVVALQYRNKSPDQSAKRAQAAALQQLCREFQTPFIINDDLQLAAALEADGAHLGRDDASCSAARQRLGAGALIGISCYDDLASAALAQRCGADYVAFGAFYPSASKKPPARAKPGLLTEARSSLHIPIVAIGGITPENGAALVAAGADVLAVIHSVYGDPEPESVVQRFTAVFPPRNRQASG